MMTHCSQRLNFKRIKNTQDTPAKIINHHTQDVCVGSGGSERGKPRETDRDRAKDTKREREV